MDEKIDVLAAVVGVGVGVLSSLPKGLSKLVICSVLCRFVSQMKGEVCRLE